MKYAVGLAALVASAAALVIPLADAESPRVLVGSKGRIQIFDYVAGEFQTTLNETVEGDPSWLAFSEPDRIYAVDEWSQSLRSYKVDLAANKLELEEQKNGSNGVVHLEFSADRKRLVGSSYAGGTVDIWNIENGLELLKTINSTGKPGPEKAQTQARVHQSVLDPSGRFFAANDLGTDTIMIFDSKDDAWTFDNIAVRPGCGPRHGVFHGSAKDAKDKASHYTLACELSNEVIVFAVTYTGDKLELKEVQTQSTLPKDASDKVKEAAAAGEVVASADGKHVYISNRVTGEDTDSVAHFVAKGSSCATFKLEAKDFHSSGSVNPRMMSLSKTGKTLFTAHVGGEFGLVALEVKDDGSLTMDSKSTVRAGFFGEPDAAAGPRFVQQIV